MKEQLPYLITFSVILLRYFLFAGVAFLFFYKMFPKFFRKNKIQATLLQRKEIFRDIGHSIQSTVIFTVVVLLILKTPLIEYTQFYTDISTYGGWWIPISTVLALILHDTYFYWMHRTVHHPRLFRHVHLQHHKAVNPSPWAAYAFHFSEGILEALITPIILLALPLHPLALISFSLVSLAVNVYGHLGYEIAPRWFRHSWLFQVLNTSVHHNLHHSKFHGNYGLYFRVWDRIMGTEHPDYVRAYDALQQKRFGESVPSSSMRRSVFWIVLVIGTGCLF